MTEAQRGSAAMWEGPIGRDSDLLFIALSPSLTRLVVKLRPFLTRRSSKPERDVLDVGKTTGRTSAERC